MDVKLHYIQKNKRTPKIKHGHGPLSQLTHQLSGAQNKKEHRARREWGGGSVPENVSH